MTEATDKKTALFNKMLALTPEAFLLSVLSITGIAARAINSRLQDLTDRGRQLFSGE